MENTKRLLGVWRSMHNRCYNKTQASFVNYGGRGIVVDAKWHGAEGFRQFLADMGPCPAGATLERKDNDGPYSAENCRWASRSEQAKNKRNSRHITANGKTLTLADWARELGCSPATILHRIKKGATEAEAVTRPVSERPNAKLTPEHAAYVRKEYTMRSMQSIADELGVSKKTIMNILHGVTFMHAA